jgi:hypothetical protein
MQQLNEASASANSLSDNVYLTKQDSNNDFQSDDAFEQMPPPPQAQGNFEAFNLTVVPK